MFSVWGGRWITTINTIGANGVGTLLVRGPAGAETARGSLRGLDKKSDKDTLPSSFLRGGPFGARPLRANFSAPDGDVFGQDRGQGAAYTPGL